MQTRILFQSDINKMDTIKNSPQKWDYMGSSVIFYGRSKDPNSISNLLYNILTKIEMIKVLLF